MAYRPVMTSCPYCGRLATTTIVSTPSRVCQEHALEFWTGLLGFATHPFLPCVKHEGICSCPVCERSAASKLRIGAVALAGLSPSDHQRAPMRLVS